MRLPRRKNTIVNGVDITCSIGRPRSESPFLDHSVCLNQEQWDFIMLWLPSGNPSQALRSLLDRAMKFWPAGPSAFGHSVKKKQGATDALL